MSAVFTAVLAMKIGNLEFFQHQYRLSAVFSDATGVFKGDAVKLAGVDVGRVSGARIENGHGVVDFVVDDSVKLTEDATVAIGGGTCSGSGSCTSTRGRDRAPASRTATRSASSTPRLPATSASCSTSSARSSRPSTRTRRTRSSTR
jgi:hypothetical protein